jgi:hypothetical protein
MGMLDMLTGCQVLRYALTKLGKTDNTKDKDGM